MKHSVLIFALLLKASLISCQQRLDLESFREWRQLDFVFPSAQIRASAIQRKQFVAENTFPIDVDVDYQGRKSNCFAFCWFVYCVTSRLISVDGQIKNFRNSAEILWGHSRQPRLYQVAEKSSDRSADSALSRLLMALLAWSQLRLHDIGGESRHWRMPSHVCRRHGRNWNDKKMSTAIISLQSRQR